MINNEMKTVKVYTYEIKNSVGQKMTSEIGRDVDMFIKIHTQTNVADPRYVDIDLVALTKDFSIKEGNVIEIDNVRYDVKYTTPSKRYLQILMKKK
jgi:hypothetical protein